MKAFAILAGDQDRLGVAVSGGSDSTALLVMAADHCAASGASCFAVTVDHGLRPEAAGEARKVRALCGKLGVSHTTLTWRRDADGPVSQEAARLARHRLIAGWARKAGVSRVALGHTRDDRLETFLMRTRQGSGWHGLAGLMPEGCSPVWPDGRGLTLVRPLLMLGRDELRGELRARGVAWIDDPSNADTRYERVRARRLVGRIEQKSSDQIIRIMDGLAQFRAAVSAEASALLRHVQVDASGETADMPFAQLSRAGDEAHRRLMEALILSAGGAARPPRREALERLLGWIDAADPRLTGGVTLAGAKIRIRGRFLNVSPAPARRGNPAPEPADWTRAGALLAPPDLQIFAL